MTYTVANLELSAEAYLEIKVKLEQAGYQHAFMRGGIDMTGIAVIQEKVEPKLQPSINNHKPTTEMSSNQDFGRPINIGPGLSRSSR